MRQLQGDGRRLQRVRRADAHDERVHPAQPAILRDNGRAAGNGEGDHGDEQGPVEDPHAAKVGGEVRGTAAVPFVAAQEGEVVFHRRGMRVVKFQPAVGDDDVPVRAHRNPLDVAAAALGAVVREGGGERGLPVLDAVQRSLRVVVRFRPVAVAGFEVDAVGATRFWIDKVLETVTRVRGERVRQVDRLLYVRQPVPFLAQRPLLDHVAPSLVRFVAEDEDVQRVLAALPPLLGGGELQRQAALLGDAEPADELLGGDAVELDRAGLNLGERGRRDAREAREAPPERGSPGIRRHDQIKSDRRPEGAQGRASDRARGVDSTRRGMDSTRTRTDGASLPGAVVSLAEVAALVAPIRVSTRIRQIGASLEQVATKRLVPGGPVVVLLLPGGSLRPRAHVDVRSGSRQHTAPRAGLASLEGPRARRILARSARRQSGPLSQPLRSRRQIQTR